MSGNTPRATIDALGSKSGKALVVLHSSPDPAMTPRIEQYAGIVLGVFALFGALWVKLVMKKGLFEPTMPQVQQAPFAASQRSSV